MITLADVLDQRRLSVREVAAWAGNLATELAALHEDGLANGNLVAAEVLTDADRAQLISPGIPAADQTRDIAQFAALLRVMLDHADPASEAERAQWNALDCLAAANAGPAPGIRAKKIALALKLLSSTRPAELKSTLPWKPSGPRVLTLGREVSPSAPANRRRYAVKTIHVGAFLATTASLGAIACDVLLHALR